MKKGFIVLTDGASTEEQLALHNMLSKEFSWFHWMPQAWVLVDARGLHTAASLRLRIGATCPGLTVVVFDVPPGANWACFTPPAWQKWLNETWVP